MSDIEPCKRICDFLVSIGVHTVVATPDSGFAYLCSYLKSDGRISYIQTVHEAATIGIAAGLNLAGRRSLAIMESSGLRSGCESLARLHLSHHIFTCLLVTNRGAIGEANWWGVAHYDTTAVLLDLLRFRWVRVHSTDDFCDSLTAAYQTFETGQCGVALVAEPRWTKGLR